MQKKVVQETINCAKLRTESHTQTSMPYLRHLC